MAPEHPAVERARARWRSEPFEWGRSDCILSVCDYVLDRTGMDPAAPWRGTYRTEGEAHEICRAHGGALGLFRHGMTRAGFIEGRPVIGAPVVVSVAGREIAGIWLGRMTMLRMERAMIDLPAQVLGAWPCA